MFLLCRGFVPQFSDDPTDKLIVDYNRNWRDFKLPVVTPVPHESEPIPVRFFTDADPEAEFEHFPDANQ